MPRRRPAFTLIELLVVIGIIAVLSSLLIFGWQRVQNNQKSRQTHVAMQTAQSFFSTYEQATHFDGGTSSTSSFQPYRNGTVPQFMWVGGTSQTYDPSSPNYGLTIGTYNAFIEQLAAPATADPAAIGASDLSQDTGMVLQQMLAVPQNLSTLNALAKSPPQVAVNAYVNGTSYKAGDKVYAPGSGMPPTFWSAQGSGALPAPPSTPAGGNTQWAAGASALLDGWGNPILFVPRGGLTGVNLSGVVGAGVVCSDGFHAGAFKPTVTQLNLLHPFWVSPGPDGNYATGDDNIYSFQQ